MHQVCERSPAPFVPVVAGAGPAGPVPWAAAADWKSIEPAATPAFIKSVLRVVSKAILPSEAGGCMRGREIARGEC